MTHRPRSPLGLLIAAMRGGGRKTTGDTQRCATCAAIAAAIYSLGMTGGAAEHLGTNYKPRAPAGGAQPKRYEEAPERKRPSVYGDLIHGETCSKRLSCAEVWTPYQM
eukprot:GHVT01095407.1.p3 GENE.GHVT01095407.1~~GHVT01095407.1.p3  ORF type:complete len:108 (-),score=13.15 GHVT01095407.1:714-1037(-)